MPLYLKYYFWLLVVSAAVFLLERLAAARREQEVVRDDLVQDLVWMVFNTQYLSWMLALASVWLVGWLDTTLLHLGLPTPQSARLLSDWPLWLQAVTVLVSKDFVEWNVHRALHLHPWLWRFHALHHSSVNLDWAATFRSHWGEIVLHKLVAYLPMVVLGVDDRVIFAVVVFSLVVQELSHANLPWDFGPLRYIVSSPRFHAWHHDVELHGRGGQNFGINLVFWDWIFGTAYFPKDRAAPAAFGFAGQQEYPSGLWARLWEPFRSRRSASPRETADAVSSAGFQASDRPDDRPPR